MSLRSLPMTSLLAGLVLSTGIAHAEANLSGQMTPSEKIATGTLSVLAAPVVGVAGSAKGESAAGAAMTPSAILIGGAFIISGIAEGAADTVQLTLDGLSGAGKLSVTVAKSAFKSVGASIGTTMQVISETTGTLLVTSGKVLALIPNKLGEALLYQARVLGSSATQSVVGQ
ncbi:hypothetical protein OL229_19645 [Neisseriaceae bacterium JH1-16]|nr:hypothetical protein [Neisseriaceae bacterium JH1-16]